MKITEQQMSTQKCQQQSNHVFLRSVLFVLLASMMLSLLAGCDVGGGLNKETGSSESETETSTQTEQESEYQEPLEFAPFAYEAVDAAECELEYVLKSFDLLDMYNNGYGRALAYGDHEKYLQEVEAHPDEEFFDYENVCNFFAYMGARGAYRQNIVLKIDSEKYRKREKEWEHSIVSTGDDFALVSRKIDERRNYYITGFVNGELYDGLHLMGSEDYNEMIEIINQNGYEKTMNAVRDEFWGRLWEWCTHETDDIVLLFALDIFKNDDTPSHETSTFIFQYLEVYSNSTQTTLSEIEPDYDVSDSFIRDEWGDAILDNKFDYNIYK